MLKAKGSTSRGYKKNAVLNPKTPNPPNPKPLPGPSLCWLRLWRGVQAEGAGLGFEGYVCPKLEGS